MLLYLGSLSALLHQCLSLLLLMYLIHFVLL